MKTLLSCLLIVISSTVYAPEADNKPLLASEVKCMMDNIHHEARGETTYNRMLVAKVVYNRSDLTGQGLCDTIYARKQFSWVGVKKGVVKHTYKTLELVYEARELKETYRFYHASRIKPVWSRNRIGTKHGNHIFYTQV